MAGRNGALASLRLMSMEIEQSMEQTTEIGSVVVGAHGRVGVEARERDEGVEHAATGSTTSAAAHTYLGRPRRGAAGVGQPDPLPLSPDLLPSRMEPTGSAAPEPRSAAIDDGADRIRSVGIMRSYSVRLGSVDAGTV